MAIALLGTIVVVSIGFFVRLTVSSTKGTDQAAALELGTKILEDYCHKDPALWAADASEELSTHDDKTNTTFYYKLSYRRLSPLDAKMGDLYRLDVSVSWWPADPSDPHGEHGRRDYGRLNLHVANVVFVENMK